MPVTPGQAYTFSYRYRANAVGGNSAFKFFLSGVNIAGAYYTFRATTQPLGVWTTNSFSWTAPATGSSTYPDINAMHLSMEAVEDGGSGIINMYLSDIYLGLCSGANAV